MKVYCTVRILKDAWQILKELGIAELFTGEAVKININELLDKLLTGNKLNAFLQIITKSERDFEDEDMAEVGQMLTDFFTLIGTSFKSLNLKAGLPAVKG